MQHKLSMEMKERNEAYDKQTEDLDDAQLAWLLGYSINHLDKFLLLESYGRSWCFPAESLGLFQMVHVSAPYTPESGILRSWLIGSGVLGAGRKQKHGPSGGTLRSAGVARLHKIKATQHPVSRSLLIRIMLWNLQFDIMNLLAGLREAVMDLQFD